MGVVKDLCARAGALRLGAVGLICLAVTACATLSRPAPEPGDTEASAEFFTRSFGGVYVTAVEEPYLPDMVAGGLEGLARADPELAVSTLGDAIVVSVAGQPIHHLPISDLALPQIEEIKFWGAATAAAFAAAYAHSPRLQALETNHLYDLFMAGMAPTLGAGAAYWTAAEEESFYNAKNGNIHISYQPVAQGIEVLGLDPEGAPAAAGLRQHDIITHIDGRRVAGLGGAWRNRVFFMLNGSSYTKANLTVIREGVAAPLDIAVQRSRDRSQFWRSQEHDGIVEFSIPYPDYGAVRHLREHLGEDGTWGGLDDFEVGGLLLDLRGGNKRPSERDLNDILFGEQIAASLLPSKSIIDTKLGRRPDSKVLTRGKASDSTEGAPIVILIDGSTSAASEVIAAALQDAERALVIGTASVGHGLVGKSVHLPHGGVLLVPAAYLFAPSGYSIEGRGVMPDICTSTAGATEEGLLAALRKGEGIIAASVRTQAIAPGDAANIAAFRARCPAVAESDEWARDLGLAVLRDKALYRSLLQGSAGS